jgi:hypothetical protein
LPDRWRSRPPRGPAAAPGGAHCRARAFQFQSLSVVKGPSATTFTPALVIATGSQSFTVTASPLAVKGMETMVLDAIYASGGGATQLVESAATRVSAVAAQAFGKRPPPWLR